MKISHHKLLEWKSFNETQRDKKDTLKYFFKNMWIGPLVSAIILIDFIITQRNNIWAFGWLLILWSFSPYIMYLLSKPRKLEEREIDEKDEEFLRIISRKTWRFFDIFVDQDSNWLPPDNYQEEPVTILAMRTSPTNMGLSLLANMTAYYYGYINLNNYLLRMEKSLDTMKSLERYRGHFYNWYDIESLQILNPPYISTVDSGNLVGYLITIKNGLKMISEEKIDPARMLLGLKDSIEVMMQQIIRKKYQREEDKLQKSQLLQDLENLKRVLSQPIDSYEDLSNVIEIVSSDISVLKSLPIINTEEELNWWFNSFIKNFDELEMEYSTFLSWWEHLSSIINLLLDNEYIKATSSNSSKNITEISNKERKISPREFFPKFYAKVKDNFTFKTLLEERNSLEKSSKVLKTQITQIQLSEKYSNFEETIDIFIKNYSRTCDSILYYLKKAQKIVNDCKEMSEIDFQFLINKDRGLFSIGYRVDLHQLDRGLYDFLASEARLASYVAIAQNQLEPKHWFKLNRQMVGDSSNLALVSWSGTTFEYLMPQIIMENYNSTLLDMTFHNVIKKQMEYGNKHNVPWGISECCYYLTDGEGNYQYKAFGVPDLGIKRGLKNDLVITPYASALALLIDSPKAI